jgi:pimeloyl-ACP methyl ester carboxylesterase
MTVTPVRIPECPEEARWIMARVKAFRFFEEPDEAGWQHGANRDYMQRLRHYWLREYDWRAAVARLNRHPHVRVDMGEGFHLHALHRRSARPDARPLLIAHGWPGSIVEFDAIIERLVTPEREDLPAFHVVAPSLPGYAWSDKPRNPVGPRATAVLYDRLMALLGYRDFVYQGGDWGSVIGGWMGLQSRNLAALHLNGYGLRSADLQPQTAEDRDWAARMQRRQKTEMGYFALQSTKPQSLGFAMMDSPMGVAAWFAEKFAGWAAQDRTVCDPPHDFDTMLTNIMIYLTTRSALSATWLYRGMILEGSTAMGPGQRVEVPTGVASFPHDLLAFPPRPMVERGYNVVHWTDMATGGHFACLEQPELFLADLRRFVAGL